MHKKLGLLFLTLVSPCFGAVTLQFSSGTGALTNLSDTASASAVNGLAWGIVIDTTGDNFQKELIGQAGLSMSDGANLGNGYLFYPGDDTTKFIIGGEGGSGAITSASELNYSATHNGKSFGIIWFEGNFSSALAPGLKYGLITNSDFPSTNPLVLPDVLPGGTTNMSSNFAGADAVRNTTLALIPEPSTALLGLLGLAGLLRRKR